jgi:hypothetical protein
MIISTQCLVKDPREVAAIKEWESPKFFCNVQSFIGFAHFY